MTEEKYSNGDIHWNTYSGKFKMFDKNGNEILKPLRTWTVFKNTDNTLEGIEAIAFAMWQVALDEIEKESDNVVFMSDDTVKLIMATLKRLEQENKELKKENENYKLYGSSTTVAPVNHTNTEYDLLYGQSMLYKSALEEISEKIKSLNKDICNNCGWHNTDNCQPNGYVCHDLIEIKNKINEVLKG